MALDECPKTEFQLKENFLTVEQSETYLCRVFDFLEEVSPRLKCRNSKTWKIRPHHSLKDTYIDPIPQLYPRTKPNLVATRGAGWVLSDLREYVTDHQIVRNYFVDKESYSGNDFICTIEGFTVLRPDDDLTNCNLGSCEKHPCWRDSSLRVVISLNSNSSLDDILVNVYGDRLSMKQGSLLMVPDRTQIGLRYVKCDRGYAPEGNELILFVHFSIHVGTEEIDRGRRIQDYFFARTFSQNGDVLEEGKDNFEWNLDNDKGYKPEKRKVRMIKAYQHTSICGHRKLSARQLQLHGLVFNCTNTDSVKEVEQSLSRLGIFYEDDYAKLHSQVTILQCSEVKSLAGQDKYLGGVSSPCGRYVYGIPGYAQRVLRITVSTGNVDMIGDSWGKGPFKWLRGVPIPSSVMGEKYPSGVCIGIPCCAKSILRIDPDTNEVVTFGHEQLSSFGKWLYHGGDLANDGFLYAVPANAPQVLRIDPRRMECSFVGPSFDGVQKWYGGLMASNGSIYGIPQNYPGVLKIDHEGIVSVVGRDSPIMPNDNDKYLWHGGLTSSDGKVVYGFPNHASQVLKIDTTTDSISLIGEKGVIQAGRHRVPQDGKYKYLGGALMPNGKAFLFPCEAERVLMIDTQTDDVQVVGPFLMEGENKYQNGFCCGNDVYGIPQRSRGILKISMTQDDVVHVEILGCGDRIGSFKDKFEGGVMDHEGNIYCMPLICKHVVKITPSLPR